MQRWYVIPFPSDVIESTLITAQIKNLLFIKELPAQSQLQKHQKQVVTLPMVHNEDTRTMRVALLCLKWLLWTSPHCLPLWLWAGICLLDFYCRSCYEISKFKVCNSHDLQWVNCRIKPVDTIWYFNFLPSSLAQIFGYSQKLVNC